MGEGPGGMKIPPCDGPSFIFSDTGMNVNTNTSTGMNIDANLNTDTIIHSSTNANTIANDYYGKSKYQHSYEYEYTWDC